MSTSDPFLNYLTIFKSRLGSSNLVLNSAGLAHQPNEALLRRVRKLIENRIEIDLRDPQQSTVIKYLIDKQLLAVGTKSSGRYAGLSLQGKSDSWTVTDRSGSPRTHLSVFSVDAWMSDPLIASTNGVATPNNASELIELSYQLGLLSKMKNTYTAAGHMISQVRSLLNKDSQRDNPYLLGADSPAYLRQVLSTDGFLIREIVRHLVEGPTQVTRDQVSASFDEILGRVVAALQDAKVPPATLKQAKTFASKIETTLVKNSKIEATLVKKGTTRGPGVLEHRVTPRLEWLTDLGYLNKEGLSKNGFEYRVQPWAGQLLESLDRAIGNINWSDSVALQQWETNPQWSDARASIMQVEGETRFIEAYRLLRRRVGPAPLKEVTFVAGLVDPSHTGYSESLESLLEFAQRQTGVTLSGGRYNREPESIYMSDPSLRQAGGNGE